MVPGRTMSTDGIKLPRFIYGTAWKKNKTKRLTALALEQGFRSIDTANQYKHYNEAAVGEGIREKIESGLIARGDLFLQTKFTHRPGQDHRLPYDPNSSIPDQVEQSFVSSLEHLGTEIIDSYVLHGPLSRNGLGRDDWATWRAMEAIYNSGRARSLGVSNVTLEQLKSLYKEACVQPRFVQNRCYASQGWDYNIRSFCKANEIIYQGFSLLTANRGLAADPELNRIASRHGRDISQIIFRFAIDIGMVPLTGTSNTKHMQADLDIFNFHLNVEEVQTLEVLAANKDQLQVCTG